MFKILFHRKILRVSMTEAHFYVHIDILAILYSKSINLKKKNVTCRNLAH